MDPGSPEGRRAAPPWRGPACWQDCSCWISWSTFRHLAGRSHTVSRGPINRPARAGGALHGHGEGRCRYSTRPSNRRCRSGSGGPGLRGRASLRLGCRRRSLPSRHAPGISGLLGGVGAACRCGGAGRLRAFRRDRQRSPAAAFPRRPAAGSLPCRPAAGHRRPQSIHGEHCHEACRVDQVKRVGKTRRWKSRSLRQGKGS